MTVVHGLNVEANMSLPSLFYGQNGTCGSKEPSQISFFFSHALKMFFWCLQFGLQDSMFNVFSWNKHMIGA